MANANTATYHQVPGAGVLATSPAVQAYHLLHFAFIAAPVLAGIDKFFHLLVNWDMYLARGSQTCRQSPPIR